MEKRRSIRSFSNRPVEKPKMDKDYETIIPDACQRNTISTHESQVRKMSNLF